MTANGAGAPAPIVSMRFDAAELLAKHPPRFRHPNKQVAFDAICPGGRCASSAMVYSRWCAMPLPKSSDTSSKNGRLGIVSRQDVYDYAPVDASPSAVEWHVNFADPDLFFAYGTGLFAQDEIQVAEHPALGSLREALLS